MSDTTDKTQAVRAKLAQHLAYARRQVSPVTSPIVDTPVVTNSPPRPTEPKPTPSKGSFLGV